MATSTPISSLQERGRSPASLGQARSSPVVSIGIKTIGRFVQMLSEVAITGNRVPGLAAMQPGSPFLVKMLNEAKGGGDRLASYYGIASNFVATVELKNGITRELGQFLLDRVTNRLFKIDNDLVVDTSSMTECGTRNSRFQYTFQFPNTDAVYHTIYFADALVPILLRDFLELKPIMQKLQQPDWARLEEFWRNHKRAMREKARRDKEKGYIHMLAEAIAREPGRRKGAAPIETQTTPTVSRSARRKEPARTRTTATVACHFAEEMVPSPPVMKAVPLFVTVSREKIAAGKSATSKTTATPAQVDVLAKIAIEVIARQNARTIGDSLVVIDVPNQRPETLRFEVEGVHPGVADLVEARQGAKVLASLVLAPVFVLAKNMITESQIVFSAAKEVMEPAVLRIYEIHELSSQLTLRFDLACLDPNIAVSELRQLLHGFSRDLYVSDTFTGIEKAWTASARIYDQFLLRLKAQGIAMANTFLPEPVRQALWQYRNQIRAIQVISEEPLIPWELLYVTDPQAGPEGKGFLASGASSGGYTMQNGRPTNSACHRPAYAM